MPIAARQQIYTTEDKFANISEILSKIKSPADASFMRNFIVEICKRYLDKEEELSKFVSPAVAAMNKYESEYIERVIRAFSL
jgi:histone H3/H4